MALAALAVSLVNAAVCSATNPTPPPTHPTTAAQPPPSWKVKLFGFDPSSPVAEGLKAVKEQHGYDYVEIDLNYTIDLYPFFPPLVKVIRPRFEGFMMGRIASAEMLQVRRLSQTTVVRTGDGMGRLGAFEVPAAVADRV